MTGSSHEIGESRDTKIIWKTSAINMVNSWEKPVLNYEMKHCTSWASGLCRTLQRQGCWLRTDMTTGCSQQRSNTLCRDLKWPLWKWTSWSTKLSVHSEGSTPRRLLRNIHDQSSRQTVVRAESSGLSRVWELRGNCKISPQNYQQHSGRMKWRMWRARRKTLPAKNKTPSKTVLQKRREKKSSQAHKTEGVCW